MTTSNTTTTKDNNNNNSNNNNSNTTTDVSSSPRIQMQLGRKRKRGTTKTTKPTLAETTTTTTKTTLASSSSSSSSEDEDDHSSTSPPEHGWRVKLYRLNTDGSWDDRGTGRIVCDYSYPQPTLLCKSETLLGTILLQSRVLLREPYQRQGDNIITWCEPYYTTTENNSHHEQQQQQQQQQQHSPGVDLALSFQDNAGCLDIWRQITTIQQEWNSVDMAHAVAAAHHASLQKQEQENMWTRVASEVHHFAQEEIQTQEDAAVTMAAAAAAAYGTTEEEEVLPNPPTLQNLEEIADVIAAAQQLQQRESLAEFMSRQDCLYFKTLLSLFGSAEARGDYGALATLAACIKTILLMNDVTILEWIVSQPKLYERVCSTLEYDPDLRDKANHRWFLRERVKFKTVVWMQEEQLMDTIHRAFRVTYLKDVLLRPTMDENSLSTLTSLQTFTHGDVVKGVMQGGEDSYLVKVLTMMGREIQTIAYEEWNALEEEEQEHAQETEPTTTTAPAPLSSPTISEATTLQAEFKKEESPTTSTTLWKQHLAPQDGSMASRLIRRRGAISFFRELFNMVRVSLQQADKDDFYAAIVNMEIDLMDDNNKKEHHDLVNLLSLMASVLSDPSASVEEKGGILEIVATIAMHDSSLIRRQCLDLHEIWKKEESERMTCPGKPNSNDAKQIIFCCSPNDLLASLLFLMAVETDAGLLLQTSEIMRIILDTDMLAENGPIEGGPPPGLQHPHMEHPSSPHSASIGSEQNNFLAMFYEHYVQWLAAPFQYVILHPVKRAPDEALNATNDSQLMLRMLEKFNSGLVSAKDSSLLRIVPLCAIRSSFAVELLSFCVRAHLHRMKFFLLRSRVLGSVMRLLKPSRGPAASSGDRCLKLAALRFLRSILSVKDEFYHRHIIQHNLFAPVFEAFRANPVGDNLVSSAIVEMCDFIHNQNIKSLIEYIVTKHLSVSSPSSVTDRPSLEDVATPYVQTLTILRKTYEEDLRNAKDQRSDQDGREENRGTGSYYDHARTGMSEKAMEDQRKFREVDEEESYFDCDDDEEGVQSVEESRNTSEATNSENDLHRTARMFSLTDEALPGDSGGGGKIPNVGERQQVTEAEKGTSTREPSEGS